MKRKKSKKSRKRKKSKLIAALSVAIGIIVILSVVSYLNQTQNSSQTKPAEEYFRVFNATVNDGEPRENGTMFIVYDVSFVIQPVGGDAHNVIIQSWTGKAEAAELGDIPQNQSKYVNLVSPRPFGVLIAMNEDGKFPLRIMVTSTEARGYITIYL